MSATTTSPATAPAATLTDAQASVLAAALANGTLGSALADAVVQRRPGDECTDCGDEDFEGPCVDHEADAERAQGYADLASGLGIELEDQ